MESYESLRLKESDKIQKTNFWDRFKKENNQELGTKEGFKESSQNTQNTLEEDPYRGNSPINETSSKELSTLMDQTSLNPQEKEEILQIDLEKREISFKMVCISIGIMLFVLLLFIPKIYIRNNIYYTSRNITQLQTQLDSLTEENKQIKKQLEDIKFRNLTHELDF
ncbi:hypothetical protein [Helicobacter canadensis]|uniref:Uncharacterized protein n=1 Tax=Helicobacter canadensis MIT 98-5491 TaxID=537970 RepID=C5ZY68_9HELI|nr:hypothetical protein [Helicobacter canadensis]EES90086.1 hypothetical protein HCAN_1381 [Helicobacter canadensis MIT 98-5491]EFR49241.1 hypothetical protein HCMG_01415 [Helicobacter canadensis MIT 98-5491]STP02408.1 Uncharacterised protein [Helicobacter canadensis]